MAEYRITHRPVLSSTFAARTSAVSLAALPEGRVIHVLGKPGGRDMTDTLRELAGPNEHGVRAAGPGQWFIVGDAPMPHADLQALFDRLAPEAFGEMIAPLFGAAAVAGVVAGYQEQARAAANAIAAETSAQRRLGLTPRTLHQWLAEISV